MSFLASSSFEMILRATTPPSPPHPTIPPKVPHPHFHDDELRPITAAFVGVGGQADAMGMPPPSPSKSRLADRADGRGFPDADDARRWRRWKCDANVALEGAELLPLPPRRGFFLLPSLLNFLAAHSF